MRVVLCAALLTIVSPSQCYAFDLASALDLSALQNIEHPGLAVASVGAVLFAVFGVRQLYQWKRAQRVNGVNLRDDARYSDGVVTEESERTGSGYFGYAAVGTIAFCAGMFVGKRCFSQPQQPQEPPQPQHVRFASPTVAPSADDGEHGAVGHSSYEAIKNAIVAASEDALSGEDTTYQSPVRAARTTIEELGESKDFSHGWVSTSFSEELKQLFADCGYDYVNIGTDLRTSYFSYDGKTGTGVQAFGITPQRGKSLSDAACCDFYIATDISGRPYVPPWQDNSALREGYYRIRTWNQIVKDYLAQSLAGAISHAEQKDQASQTQKAMLKALEEKKNPVPA